MFYAKLTAAALAGVFSIALINAGAIAFPGGGANDKSTTTNAPVKKSAKKICRRGETVKRVKRAGKYKYVCVKLKAEVLPDAELYQQARMLADEGEYEWALDHLRLIKNQNDPEVLNYTGYSNRKAGRLETGISYYHQALAIDPNYVQAREYLGEAYVLAGRIDLAKAQLQEIAWRCGKTCVTYKALDAAISETAQ